MNFPVPRSTRTVLPDASFSTAPGQTLTVDASNGLVANVYDSSNAAVT